jgi:hypothetical protein
VSAVVCLCRSLTEKGECAMKANLGSSIFFSLGALMLYYVFYQARLIPRWITVWGIVAGVLYLTAGLAAVSGINLDFLKYIMPPQEMVMAVWLIVKGFSLSAVTSEPVKTGRTFA